MPFNRTRERGSKLPVYKSAVAYYQWPSTGKWHAKASSTFPFTEKKERIDDFVPVGEWIPGTFKITDVQMFRTSQDVTPLSFQFNLYPRDYNWKLDGSYNGPHAYVFTGDYLPPMVPNSSDISRLALRASAKMQSATVDTGELFAETGSSLKMLANPLSGLAQYLLNAVRGKRGGRRSLVDASNVWLESRYGWSPLVKDLQNLYDGVLDGVELTPDVKTSKASKVDEVTTEVSPFWARPLFQEAPECLVHGNSKEKVVKRATYYYRIIDPQLYAGIKRGSSIVNAPKLLYNLTNLSFALDWWWDLGTWISAMTPNPSVEILGFTYSLTKEVTKVSEVSEARFNYFGEKAAAFARYTEHQKYYLRLVRPPPHHSLPKLDTTFNSVKHAIDGLALIHQRIPRR